ncbi:MAG: hypothetical protein WBM44_20270 [Waterburya sp.]
MKSNFTALTGIVKPRHQVTSVNAKDSPYERVTIERIKGLPASKGKEKQYCTP